MERTRPFSEVFFVSRLLYLIKAKSSLTFPIFAGSGSHLNSIQMVAQKKADVATVDSNVLGFAFSKHPALKEDIHVFDSLGPFPSYPIMVRASLPDEEKKAIANALLQLDQVSPWNERCTAFRLHRFIKIDKDVHTSDRDSLNSLDNIRIAGVLTLFSKIAGCYIILQPHR